MEDSTQNPTTQPPRNWRLLIGVGISFALAWFVLSNIFNGPSRTPIRYLFPQGFVGKYSVEIGVKTASPLPVEDGYIMVRVPANGRLQTSSTLQDGWANDEFYYVSPDGKWKELSQNEENGIVQEQSIAFGHYVDGMPQSICLEGFIGSATEKRNAS